MQIALAPMEGVVDARMRALLTAVGGIDWCVTEFIRVTRQHLPAKVFHALAPELRRGARTPAGTPVHVQLLGSDPDFMADNAARACTLGAPVIDLNFGCPAKTVNQSRGGAVLLDEPELLHAIVRAVRSAVPAQVPVTAKMRLGYTDTQRALDCAHALADGGAAEIVVHARTKLDGYQPPAYWEWIACIAEAIAIPVYANGEIWSVAHWQRCREISGVNRFMLGRGLIARPDLARQIAAAAQGHTITPMPWAGVLELLRDYWLGVRDELSTRHAPGRIKQWLFALARNYPQAQTLFDTLRRERDCAPFDACFARPRSTGTGRPADEAAPAHTACA